MFRSNRRSLGFACIAAGILALAFFIPAASGAQCAQQEKTAAFIKSLTGEWIGTCQQITDGDQTEDKYFCAKFEQTGDNIFSGKFTYYRLDPKTGELLNIGETTMASTIQADGTVKNDIAGKGKMLVSNQPKDQEHQLTEVLTVADNGSIVGKLDGKIDVSGMPFGLGRNGKIRNATSAWKLEDGVMTIDQSLKAAFKVLMATKTFKIEAHSVARRGTDVITLMKKDQLGEKVAARPATGS